MIGTIVQVIFVIIILGVCWWAIQRLLPLIPLPPPFATIVHVLAVLLLVIIVLWVIWTILVASGITSGRPFRVGGIAGGAVTAFPTEAAGYLLAVLM